MILENKFLRIKRQRYNLIITILVSFFLLFFAAIFLFSNTDRELSIDQNVGSVIMQGKIQVDNNYPFYTHVIDSSGGRFFLKSSYLNLNDFVGQDLLLVGKLDSTREGEVLNVQTIQDLQRNYILRSKEYIFPHDFFILNSEADANIAILQEHNQKKVFYNGNEIFSVKSFICNKIIDGQDCALLRKNMIKKYVKTFVSSIGYNFYQFNDRTWYVLEKNANIGYIFSLVDKTHEDDFVALSYVFRAIDGRYLSENRRNIISADCLQSGQVLQQIQSIKKETILNDTYLKFLLDLRIKSEKNNQISTLECKEQINLADITTWLE